MQVVTVEDINLLIQKHGFNSIILELIAYLKQDFLNWQNFDKSSRHATHVKDGVIELMPIASNNYYTYKYVNGHPKNPNKGKQTVVAVGQLSNVSDGYPLMFSEMTVLTALRTAATAALATDLMARKNSSILAIVGTGAQSEFQVLAHTLVRTIKEVRYFDIDAKAMNKFKNNMVQQLPEINFVECKTAQDAVNSADIIVVCTACKDHVDVIMDEWIKPGVHINGLGGDCPGKTELELPILYRGRVVVEYTPQSLVEGEIQRISEQEVSQVVYGELWELINGSKIGRDNSEEITIFDSVGFALEDYSVLRLVHQLTKQYGLGRDLNLLPPLNDPKNLFSVIKSDFLATEAQSLIHPSIGVELIGAAIDACAGIKGAYNTPDIVKHRLQADGISFDDIYRYNGSGQDINSLANYFDKIAKHVNQIMKDGGFPLVIGGDHSCAIATWSGVLYNLNNNSPTDNLGLIWVDAHLDAHRPDTSLSGNIHGMPVATLLGKGYTEFLQIMNKFPSLEPQHLVIIGARSFEAEEVDLIQQLGVKVFYADEVKQKGIDVVLDEARSYLFANGASKLGFSVDVDGFDPLFTPGVGTTVANGIDFNQFVSYVETMDWHDIVAFEITECNNLLDNNDKTINCVIEIIKLVISRHLGNSYSCAKDHLSNLGSHLSSN